MHSFRAGIRLKQLVLVFLFFAFIGNIVSVKPATAQVWVTGEVINVTAQDIPREASEAKQAAEMTFGMAVLNSVVGAAYNSVNFFLRKLALDTARYLGESAAGKKSLVFEKPAGQYWEEVANGTLGEAIASIGDPFGLNLCEIPDINLKLFLQIGIGDLYGQNATPRCDWAEIRNNWSAEGFERKYGKGASRLIPQKWSDVISVQQSDFGIAMSAVAQVDALRAQAKAAAQAESYIGQGFRDLKDKISDTILTPARFLAEIGTQNLLGGNELLAGIQLTGAGIANGAAQIIPVAAQTFLGSYISSLLQQTIQEGIFQPTTYDPNFFGIGNGRQRAPAGVLSSLETVQIVTVPDYDLLLNYVSCPQNPRLDNCVMDQSLYQALSRGTVDKPLTIREAIQSGLLHGDWPLISPRRETAADGTGNIDRTCYSKAYCYSNIQKLRKARILPLGFEVAALKADPDNPQAEWTLKKIVDNFDNCAPDGRPNAQFPYCHLINPNWVIRSFPVSCQTQAVGPNLITPQSPDRALECVDVATCLQTDSNGNCISQGYCTQERMVWRLSGDQCAPEYATCRTYRRSDGASASYLTRTLDFSTCSADAVGCRAFSTERDAQGNWIPSINANAALNTIQLGRNQTLHLSQAGIQKTCPAGAVGCNAFITALRTTDQTQFVRGQGGTYVQAPATVVNQMAFLKKAPDYLGCYDTNIATPQIDWPRTRTEAQSTFERNAACANYAAACSPEEVGCESYRSVANQNAPAIPGIVGGNACAAQCVGYDTFKQEETAFEPERFPLYFIPSQGQQCAVQYAGCTQFTNIDSSAQGGERLEYYTSLRRCERPSVNAGQTYYSWEGSDREGFVLRVHRLVSLDAAESEFHGNSARAAGTLAGVNYADLFAEGSPAYIDDSSEALRTAATRCNEANYTIGVNNPIDPARADIDCRALYNTNGQVFYRLLSQTVVVSDSCTRLRKTENTLYTDEYITSLPAGADTVCRQHGGQWGPAVGGGASVCQRCAAGGQFENGACIYQANTQNGQSSSCPATANGCRVYVGNTGRNVFASVINDSFEGNQSPAQLDWAPVPANGALRIASEAVIVGEHSLAIPGGVSQVTKRIPAAQVVAGRTFRLSFWARSETLQNIDIYLTQNGNRVNASNIPYGVFTPAGLPVGLTPGWREFTLGPVTLGDVDPQQDLLLTFTRVNAGTAEFFLDYVQLTELGDQTALIRNSWQRNGVDVPAACDSTPNDVFPGEALGCKEYRDSKNRTVYATGFESICREAAVGCEPVWDTHNTLGSTPDALQAQAFNVWCDAQNTAECNARVNGIEYRCTVPRGETGCYIQGPVYAPTTPGFAFAAPLRVVPTTVIIPADTPVDTPIFITNRQDVSCRSSELGCTEVALEERVLPRNDATAFRFTTTYIQNNPALYTTSQGGTGILCQAEQLGCQEFRSDNTVSYFRDPEVTSGAVCEYLTGQRIGQTTVNGWFLKDVGQCSQNAALTCRTDSDCGGNNVCNVGAKVACDPTFIRRTASGVVYDIRSNDSPEYAGRAGVCAPEAHLCTEFVDPEDVSDEFPAGRPYYVKNNDKIRSKAQACASGVSQSEGCVLFDQTDNSRKTFNTDATYAASENTSPPYGTVSPRSASNVADNNANIVLKVDRDRVCSEWLACKGKVVQEDGSGNKQELCYDYKACNKMGPGGTCENWVGEERQQDSRQLTEEVYIQRPLGWNDPEYSGYSLFNQFQVGNQAYVIFDLGADKLVNRNLPNSTDLLARLERLESSSYAVYKVSGSNNDCRSAGPNDRSDWRVCGPSNVGRCFAGECLRPTRGTFPSGSAVPSPGVGQVLSVQQIESLLGSLEPASCKAYPEDNAPFPQSVIQKTAGGKIAQEPVTASGGSVATRYTFQNLQDFTRAGVCQSVEDCSCAYQKLTYENNTVDYWPEKPNASGVFGSLPQGICASGPNQGSPCSTNEQCGENIACVPLKTTDTFLGLQGFCLERDYSRRINGQGAQPEYACLTWLPIQVSASTFDVFNADDEAGYKPELDAMTGNSPLGGLYCTAGTRLASGLAAPAVDTRTPQFAVTNAADAQARRNQFFTNTATVNNDCADIQGPSTVPSAVPYKQLVCRLGQSAQFGAFQSWVWNPAWDANEQSHPNGARLVLRLETKPEQDDETDFDTIIGYGDYGQTGAAMNVYNDDVEDAMVLQPLHFAPAFEGGDDIEPYPGQGDETGSLGTLLHPPRTWGLITRQASDDMFEFRYIDPQVNRFVDTKYLGVPQLPNNSPYAIGVTGPQNEPDDSSSPPVFYNDIGNPYIVQRHEASVLRLQDLQKVVFVPTAYPGGAEGVNPALFSTDFAIDFGAIDRANNNRGADADHILVRSVRDTFFNSGALSNGEFFSNAVGTDARMLSYKRERCGDSDPTNCLGPYSDYTRAGSMGTGWIFNQYNQACQNNVNSELCRRNRIQSRYVSVFYISASPDAGGQPGVMQPAFVPATLASGETENLRLQGDPFDTAAVRCDHGQTENWFAIGMDFNADGEFLGFISRWCNATPEGFYSNNSSNGIMFATVAELSDQCTQFVQTYNNVSLSQETNKAWTNRVWEHASNGVNTSVPIPQRVPIFTHPDPVFPVNSFVRTVANPPFGSLPARQAIAEELPNFTFKWTGSGSSNADDLALLADGVPYACAGNSWKGFPYAPNAMNDHCQSLLAMRGAHPVGSYVSSFGTTAQRGNELLAQLFAKTYDERTLQETNVPTNVPTYSDGEGVDLSRSLNIANNLLAPQIFSLNPRTCQSPINGRNCSVGEQNNLTVNGRNSTMANYDRSDDSSPDEDRDQSGFPDPIIGLVTVPVRLQFFAAADDNKMPIRQVRVDWSDGGLIINQNQEGLYKNRKPYCDVGQATNLVSQPVVRGLCGTAANQLSSITCSTHDDCPAQEVNDPSQPAYRCYGPRGTADQDLSNSYQFARFGNSPRACVPRPFTFIKDYSCSLADVANPNRPTWVQRVGDLQNPDAQTILRGQYGLNDNSLVCVYRPRVQVKDNWGWCNGVNNDGSPRAQGWYDGSDTDTLTDNECGVATSSLAWTAYQGQIIVIPSR